ncbi:MAG: hypothetical protein ACPG5W_03205 [Flavobacteriales bacterium]
MTRLVLAALILGLCCSSCKKEPNPTARLEHTERAFSLSGNQVANGLVSGFQSIYILGTSTVGGSSRAIILKLDENADLLWTKEIGNQSKGNGIICTNDDKLLLIGSEEDEVGNQDVFLAKLDDEGQTVWERTFGGPLADQGRDVIELDNGDLMIIGTTQSFGAGVADMYVIKTDSDGNEIWSRTFGGVGLDGGSELIQTSSFQVMLLGFTESFGAGNRDIYLQGVSTDGDSLASFFYGGADYEESQGIAETWDGSYVMSNHSASEEPNHSLLATKLDVNGNILWETHFGTTTEHEGGESVLSDYDGNHIFLGRTNSFGNDEQVYFVKTDADGNLLEELNFGGMGDQRGNDIIETPKAYLITGTSMVNGGSDVLFVVHPK